MSNTNLPRDIEEKVKHYTQNYIGTSDRDEKAAKMVAGFLYSILIPSANLDAKRLVDYIYEFAWHYGRLYHIGDAEKIKEAISEKFKLPEEYLKTTNQ